MNRNEGCSPPPGQKSVVDLIHNMDLQHINPAVHVRPETCGNSVASPPALQKTTIRRRKGKAPQDEHFPVPPRVLIEINTPHNVMNHSYRDCSHIPPSMDYITPTSIDQMTFAEKVHHMLSDQAFSTWISWMPHGRAFRILVPKLLEKAGVFQKYFGHSRFPTFLRHLSNYGFKHITRGDDRNCYYHEFMLRGMPHLCRYMPPVREARRLIPDPANEPNFYLISKSFPLLDDSRTLTTLSATDVNTTMPPGATTAEGTPSLHTTEALESPKETSDVATGKHFDDFLSSKKEPCISAPPNGQHDCPFPTGSSNQLNIRDLVMATKASGLDRRTQLQPSLETDAAN